MNAPSKLVGILDLEASWRRIVGNVFTARGDRVVEISDAKDLKSKLSSLDALSIDPSLAKADGFELLSRVGKERPALPVLVFTADARVESVVRAMRAGVFDYLTKPKTEERLAEAADRLMAASSLRTMVESTPDLPTLEELENLAIDRALTLSNGRVTKAARMLGIGRATLYRKLSLRSEPGSDPP